MVLAFACAAQDRWAEMMPVTEELMKAFPTSTRGFGLAVMAYGHLKRLDKWDSLVWARMREHPDEMDYVRSFGSLAEYRGDFSKAREIFRTIIDKGKATPYDLN
jgi:hypothetical protein